VGRFFELYNAIWQHNWGFAPMPEAEIRHLAKQIKQMINHAGPSPWSATGSRWRLPGAARRQPAHVEDPQRPLLPTGWLPLLFGMKRLKQVRVIARGSGPTS